MDEKDMEGTQSMAENRSGENWTILPDFKWNPKPDEQICQLTAFPVERQLAQQYTVEARCRLEVETLAASVRELLQMELDRNSCIKIVEAPVRIYPGLHLIVEDYARIELTIHDAFLFWGRLAKQDGDSLFTTEALVDQYGIPVREWRFPYAREVAEIFSDISAGGWGEKNKEVQIEGVALKSSPVELSPDKYYHFSSGGQYAYNGDKHRDIADVYVAEIPAGENWLTFMLSKGWTPESALNKNEWDILLNMFCADWLEISAANTPGSVNLLPTPKLLQEKAARGQESGDIGPMLGSAELFEQAKEALLKRDWDRANITVYDQMQLEDPGRGSWELWEPDLEKYAMMAIPQPVYARDPRQDVKQGGIVGIDFGTKSTVVVCQTDSTRIRPMRVGSGQYQREPQAEDYENPTMMEFINLEHFLEVYKSSPGRPLTSWKDLTISHTAFEQWEGSERTDTYFAFFDELKQWAGSAEREARVRDKAGNEFHLPPYLSLIDGEFDPIEIYAYYIGLYINNMHTKSIYLEYLMSFPVTFSQAIRQKILESFRRGLKKSLPAAVLNDPEYSEQFSVEQGVEEPAAYAACALQSYGISPTDGERVYYGVFDFGGGTTDFDFGIWRKASGEGEKRYRYVIEHFGAGGDYYLGGENLLEMLSFSIFQKNMDILRQNNISFFRPPHCQEFPGCELLLSDSQEARTNLKLLMEAVRPFWERTDNQASAVLTSGTEELELFSQDRKKIAVKFETDFRALEDLLKRRIAEGIDKFFGAMQSAFCADTLWRERCIHIFLAGNASRSPLLQELFEEKIRCFSKRPEAGEIGAIEPAALKVDDEHGSDFVLHYPLGTLKAREQMRTLGNIEKAENILEAPTGKTGVAIGLVQCRSGSKIKVISEKARDAEIKFQYWVGDNEDGLFKASLTPGTPYQNWIEFISADEEYFEFYYTMSPVAAQNDLDIDCTKKYRSKRIPASAVNADWMIYLRPIGPQQLEYVVAQGLEDATEGTYQFGPIQVLLKP